MSTAADQPMINVQIDGAWMQVPKGTNAVEAAKLAGKFIPHYCYHPKLAVVGNCRMCLIEMGMPKMNPDRTPEIGADGRPVISWIPRPAIGCATQLSEGMGIRTDSPMAQDCRKGVMEFLLANHPLDCPICDQAGECKLQEFSIGYGNAESRFAEEKVKKPKQVDIGERIMLDDERCILCTRCIRFTRDIAGDDCLGIVSRGSLNYIAVHPDRRFDNNYSLNTVDLCPVGALTSKDFRFKMRVWFLKETKSICTSCGTGCNILIGSREDTVHRLTPRDNEAVNGSWMCDHGRLNFHALEDEKRLTHPAVRVKGTPFNTDWADALDKLSAEVKKFAPSEVGIVASARMTNEELYLAHQLRAGLGEGTLVTVPRPQQADHLLVCADGNPNTNGAAKLGVATDADSLARLREAVEQGSVKALLVFGEDLTLAGWDASLLSKLQLLAVSSILPHATTDAATYLLPSAGFAEKRGTMVSLKNRMQRVNKAVTARAEIREDWEYLAGLLRRSGGKAYAQWDEVFADMVAATPAFAGVSWNSIGDAGIVLA